MALLTLITPSTASPVIPPPRHYLEDYEDSFTPFLVTFATTLILALYSYIIVRRWCRVVHRSLGHRTGEITAGFITLVAICSMFQLDLLTDSVDAVIFVLSHILGVFSTVALILMRPYTYYQGLLVQCSDR
jgi:hypothetical protein